MELPRLPPGGEVGGAGLSVQATAIRSVASTSSRRPHHSDRDATGRDDAAPSHAGSNAAGDLSGWSSEEGSHMLPLLPSAQAAPAEAGVAVPRASVGPSGGAAPPRARTTVKSLSYSRKRDGGGLTSAELMHRGDDAGSGVPAPARRSASARTRGAAAAKPTAAEPCPRGGSAVSVVPLAVRSVPRQLLEARDPVLSSPGWMVSVPHPHLWAGRERRRWRIQERREVVCSPASESAR
jgi:hypothetical protein